MLPEYVVFGLLLVGIALFHQRHALSWWLEAVNVTANATHDPLRKNSSTTRLI
jgi:hypothetical protein